MAFGLCLCWNNKSRKNLRIIRCLKTGLELLQYFSTCTGTAICRGNLQPIYLPIQKGILPLKSHNQCMCCSLATLVKLPRYLGSTREDRVISIPLSDRQLPSTYQKGVDSSIKYIISESHENYNLLSWRNN